MLRLLAPRGQWPSLAPAAGVRHLARRSGRRLEPEEGAAQEEEEVLEGRGRKGGRAKGEGVGFFGGALPPERGGKGGTGAELWPSTWQRGAAGAHGGPWDEGEELPGRQRPPAAKSWGGKGLKGIRDEGAWGGSVEGRGSMGSADLRSQQAGTGPSRGKGGRGLRGDLSDSDDEFDYRSQALMDKGRSKGNGKGPLARAPSSEDDRSTAHSTGRALDFSDSEDERSAPSQSVKGKGKGKRPGKGTFSESSDSDDEQFQQRQGSKGKGKGKRLGKGSFSDNFDGEDEPSELSQSRKGKGKGKRLGKGSFSDNSDGEDEPSELSQRFKGKGKGKRLGKGSFSDNSDGEDEPSELSQRLKGKGKGKGKRLGKGTFSDDSDGEDEPSELSQSWKGKGKGKRQGKGAFSNSFDGEDEPYGVSGKASSKGKSRGSSLQDEDQDPGGRYLPPGEGNRIRNTRQFGQGRLPYSFEDYPTPGENRGGYPDSDDEYRMTSRLGKGANLDHDTLYQSRSKGGKSKGAKGKGKNKDGLHFGDVFEDDDALPGKGGFGRGKGKKGGKGRGFYP